MQKVIIATLLSLLGIAECVAQQKQRWDPFEDPKMGYYILWHRPWELVEPQAFIAEQKQKSQLSQIVPTADMEEVPMLKFNERMLAWDNTTRYDFWQKPYPESVHINRLTGLAIKDNKLLEKSFILVAGPPPPLSEQINEKEPPLERTFAQMPSDSLFVVDMPYSYYVWGCVDNGALRLFCQANEYKTFRDYAVTTYGSIEGVLKWHKQRVKVEERKREKFNRFASMQEAEEFLRSDFSIFAYTFPNKKSETFRRFCAMLAQHTPLTATERNTLRHHREEIVTIAGIYDDDIRDGEYKKLITKLFDGARQIQFREILTNNYESVRFAEERVIHDRYEGWPTYTSGGDKAICIYFIYGVKKPIPIYSLTLLEDVESAQKRCGDFTNEPPLRIPDAYF